MNICNKFSSSTTFFLSALAFAGVSIGLTGCGNDSTQKTTGAVEQQAQSAFQADDKEMIVHTVTRHGKPGAGVTVKYKVPAKVNPGDTIDVELNFSVPSGAGELTVEIRSEGLEILTRQTRQTFSLASESDHKMSLSIYCGEAGRFYLNLFLVRSSGPGQLSRRQAQALSVPIQVGDAVARKSKESKGELQGLDSIDMEKIIKALNKEGSIENFEGLIELKESDSIDIKTKKGVRAL